MSAIRRTFEERGAQPIPEELPQPPVSWEAEFAAEAKHLDLPVSDLEAAIARLRACWQTVRSKA